MPRFLKNLFTQIAEWFVAVFPIDIPNIEYTGDKNLTVEQATKRILQGASYWDLMKKNPHLADNSELKIQAFVHTDELIELNADEVKTMIKDYEYSFDAIANKGNEWLRQDKSLIAELFKENEILYPLTMTLDKEMIIHLVDVKNRDGFSFFEEYAKENPEIEEDIDIVLAAAKSGNLKAADLLVKMRDERKELPISNEEVKKVVTMAHLGITEQEYQKLQAKNEQLEKEDEEYQKQLAQEKGEQLWKKDTADALFEIADKGTLEALKEMFSKETLDPTGEKTPAWEIVSESLVCKYPTTKEEQKEWLEVVEMALDQYEEEIETDEPDEEYDEEYDEEKYNEYEEDPYEDPMFSDEGVPQSVLRFQQLHPEMADADPEEIQYMLNHPEEFEESGNEIE